VLAIATGLGVVATSFFHGLRRIIGIFYFQQSAGDTIKQSTKINEEQITLNRENAKLLKFMHTHAIGNKEILGKMLRNQDELVKDMSTLTEIVKIYLTAGKKY
jgi:hypothetical protein